MKVVTLKADTWKDACQAVSYLQVLSVFVCLFGVSTLVLSLLTKGGGHDISVAWSSCLFVAIIGGAAALGRKTTAVLFSVLSICAVILIIASILMNGVRPRMLDLLVNVFPFCIPAFLTYRGWDALK